MKYIYALLEAIPQLQQLLPRELWLMIDDCKQAMFKRRCGKIQTLRAIWDNRLLIYQTSHPKLQHVDREGSFVCYMFKHQAFLGAPVLEWEVSYWGNVTMTLNFSFEGRRRGTYYSWLGDLHVRTFSHAYV